MKQNKMAEPSVVAEFPSTTLKAHIVARLRHGITSGKYRPGERLNESKLARQYGVSRIPVREALVQLQEQGLVMNHPRRGMFVNSLGEEDTQKVNSIRIILEAEAMKLCRARLCSEKNANLRRIVTDMERWEIGSDLDAAALDLEFHRAIWTYSGNSFLVRTLEGLVPAVLAHHALDAVAHDMVRWSLNHHRVLLEVVQGKSRLTPEEAIVTHLRMCYSNPECFSSFGIQDRGSMDRGSQDRGSQDRGSQDRGSMDTRFDDVMDSPAS
jgi:DNA-binding GntR family transcriptional regulator